MRVLFLALLSFSALASTKYDPYIKKYSKRFNVDESLVRAVIKVESAYNTKAAGPDDYGNGYSYGLMQLQLITANDIGYKGNRDGLYHPEVNIAFGIKYLKQCIEWANGDVNTALDMYNRGVGRVRKYPYRGLWKNHRYVKKILIALNLKIK